VPEVEFTAIGVDPGELLDQMIERRLAEMRDGGLVDEVTGLRKRLGRTAASAVGYRELLAYLDGQTSEAEAFEEVAVNTRRLARRQRTWFQRDPRIRWLPWLDDRAGRVDRAIEALT
jgi:tRNA dimethylallyltransferase